jgi:imidazoleglycerol phosphate dehydratase HisB
VTTDPDFTPVRVRRRTAETDFEIVLSPRTASKPSLDLPNRLLSHFLDHFSKAAGIAIELSEARWPSSWEFDHVLCEDLGQLVGRGVKAIAWDRTSRYGTPGRAAASSIMDDAESSVSIAFESRARCDWRIPPTAQIDGFADVWYGAGGTQAGAAFGTNLRQFFDGFAQGGAISLCIEIIAAGNLHHAYETVFRNLGDAVALALGTERRLPGESSGLAGVPLYEVTSFDAGPAGRGTS